MCASHLYMSELSQSHLPYFFHHGRHSHFILDIHLLNPFSPNFPRHPSRHPYFCYLHHLDVWVLEQLTLYRIQLGWSDYHYIKLIFKTWWHIFSHKTPYASLHFIHPSNIWCVASLSNSYFPWIIDPKYLKLSLLEMSCILILTFITSM